MITVITALTSIRKTKYGSNRQENPGTHCPGQGKEGDGDQAKRGVTEQMSAGSDGHESPGEYAGDTLRAKLVRLRALLAVATAALALVPLHESSVRALLVNT